MLFSMFNVSKVRVAESNLLKANLIPSLTVNFTRATRPKASFSNRNIVNLLRMIDLKALQGLNSRQGVVNQTLQFIESTFEGYFR